MSLPPTRADNASTAATERSMPPVMIIAVIPTAIIPIPAASVPIARKLSALKKVLFVTANAAHIATKNSRIGNSLGILLVQILFIAEILYDTVRVYRSGKVLAQVL